MRSMLVLSIYAALFLLTGCGGSASQPRVEAPEGYTPEKIRALLQLGIRSAVNEAELRVSVDAISREIEAVPQAGNATLTEYVRGLEQKRAELSYELQRAAASRAATQVTLRSLLENDRDRVRTMGVVAAFQSDLRHRVKAVEEQESALVASTPEGERKRVGALVRKYQEQAAVLELLLEQSGYKK